ncbi:phage shock envelope stress response protein PspM [Actinophytocola sp.]|uniref:phage shock envelope stress response protein PspM n=1 Tax=Actinophytocola sp. TaxID=1872138 RepID=UPI00389A1FF6
MARHERPPSGAIWPAVLWTVWWAGVASLMLVMAVAQWTGLDPEPDYDAALGGVITAAMASGVAAPGLLAARRRRANRVVVRPDVPPRIEPENRYRLPRPGSAARPPMRQLANAESALAALLRQLEDAAVPAAVIERTRQAAGDRATNLRAAGARIEAVEVAAAQLPPPARAAIEDDARDLLTRIEQGLDGYRGLIAAAGRVLLACAPVATGGELAEETERLVAMAAALRELSTPDPPTG